MIRTKKRLVLCAGLLALNLAFIWGNSLMPAEVSQAFSDWVKRVLLGMIPGDMPVTEGSGLLRKIAHFTEFAALGALLGWLLGMLDKHKVFALGLGCLAACVDETIQAFIPGRAPGVLDVCIDTAGAGAGILLLILGYALLQRIRKFTISGGKTK